MKIKYVNHDLLDYTGKIILHGCNAQHKMGAGIAKEIWKRFPEAYEVYMNRSKLFLGDVIPALSNDRIILNCISQEFYGRDGRKYVSYDALDQIFKTVDQFLDSSSFDEVAMPMIGCSLGGGNWNIVSSIIEENSNNFQPLIFTGK